MQIPSRHAKNHESEGETKEKSTVNPQTTSDFRRDFQEKFAALMATVDAVSPEQQPALRALAKQIEQSQCNIESDYEAACELADDLQLRISSTIFDLWACRLDAKNACVLLEGRVV
jgi:hypothetical protein